MTVVLKYDNDKQRADLVLENGHFKVDDGLETAVSISLFTERRLADDDLDPGATYHGGWWGDTFTGDKIGSRLWKLRNKVATEANVALAKTYMLEALQWMIDDAVASRIEVTTSRGTTVQDLRFTINIYSPGEASPWSRTWEKRFNEL